MPTAIVYHVTPRANEKSIRKHGVFGDTPWVVQSIRLDWAIRHTMKRHGTDDVSVIPLRIQRHRLTKYKRGIFKHDGPISAHRIPG